MKAHYMQQGAGHFGIITGEHWHNHVLPRVLDFIGTHDKQALRNAAPKCVPSAPV
jgi:poly-beta-hydroxyalkanoate depolymerase